MQSTSSSVPSAPKDFTVVGMCVFLFSVSVLVCLFMFIVNMGLAKKLLKKNKQLAAAIPKVGTHPWPFPQ